MIAFSLSMKYLKDEAVKTIREVTGDQFYSAKDFQWVLTVPAIWTAAAKQFMREAAYKVRRERFLFTFLALMTGVRGRNPSPNDFKHLKLWSQYLMLPH